MLSFSGFFHADRNGVTLAAAAGHAITHGRCLLEIDTTKGHIIVFGVIAPGAGTELLCLFTATDPNNTKSQNLTKISQRKKQQSYEGYVNKRVQRFIFPERWVSYVKIL